MPRPARARCAALNIEFQKRTPPRHRGNYYACGHPEPRTNNPELQIERGRERERERDEEKKGRETGGRREKAHSSTLSSHSARVRHRRANPTSGSRSTLEPNRIRVKGQKYIIRRSRATRRRFASRSFSIISLPLLGIARLRLHDPRINDRVSRHAITPFVDDLSPLPLIR